MNLKLTQSTLPLATVTDQEFHDFFQQFGAIVDSVVMFDRNTHRSRGFGFVTFEDPNVSRRLLHMTPSGHERTDYPPGMPDSQKVGRLVMHGKTCEVKAAEPKDGSNRRWRCQPRSPGSQSFNPPLTDPLVQQPPYAMPAGSVPFAADDGSSSVNRGEGAVGGPYPPVGGMYYYPPGVVPGYMAPMYYPPTMPAATVESDGAVQPTKDETSANDIPVAAAAPVLMPVEGSAAAYAFVPFQMQPPPSNPQNHGGGYDTTHAVSSESAGEHEQQDSVMQPVAPGIPGREPTTTTNADLTNEEATKSG